MCKHSRYGSKIEPQINLNFTLARCSTCQSGAVNDHLDSMRKRAGHESSKLLCLTLLSCFSLTTNAGLLWPKPQNEVIGHCICLPQAILV